MKIELQSLGKIKSIEDNLAVFCQKGSIQFGTPTQFISPDIKNAVSRLGDKSISGPETFPGTLETYVQELPALKGLDKTELIRIASYKLAGYIQKRSQTSYSIVLGKANAQIVSAICQGFLSSGYTFDSYKTDSKEPKEITLSLYIDGKQKREFQKVVDQELILNNCAETCKDLVNEPGSSLTPKSFVQRAQKLAKENSDISIVVRDKKQLKKENFNGLLTVGKGSPNDPYMATLSYTHPKARKDTKLVLVGKGVTFDTGGISLKPPGTMWEMKMDMGGAATVIGAFKAIAELKLPINISAVVCLAENRPGQDAVLPGDIFTAKNGKTIHVENTDAEGRLVLTDGLAEAGEIGATHIIDLATLTGAIIRALGPNITGLFSNTDTFASKIIKAGKGNGEKFWQMPLEMEYREEITDSVADLRNMGESAGAIIAGLFLQEFVPENTVWAHLDIAGTAFITKEWKYYKSGATAWGVRSLVTIAEELSKK